MRRKLLAILGAFGLGAGLISSGIAAQADTSISDSTFNALVNFYVTVTNNGGTFCYPRSTTCPTISQTSTNQSNFAVCVEYSNSSPVTQTCNITQTSGSGNNIAIIIQRIRQNGAGVDAHQNGHIHQTSVAGANLAATVQVISQQFGNANEDPIQQNTQFSSTDQTSTSGGRNFKLLKQSSQQDAQSSLGGTQTSSEQGTINQHSSALSEAFAFQDQHQGLTGGGPQIQSIDPRCCSAQDTNTRDVFQITQTADQQADNPAASQDSSTVGLCNSTGNCAIDQTASSNAGFNHNHLTCTGPCSTAIGCNSATCTPCTPAPTEGTCTPAGLAPVVTMSSYGMVAVRGSSVASSRSASRYAGVARSAPSAALLT